MNKPESHYNIRFETDGKEVGRLEWDDGKLIFKGNVEKSAKIFFDYLKDVLIDPYVKKKLSKR